MKREHIRRIDLDNIMDHDGTIHCDDVYMDYDYNIIEGESFRVFGKGGKVIPLAQCVNPKQHTFNKTEYDKDLMVEYTGK